MSFIKGEDLNLSVRVVAAGSISTASGAAVVIHGFMKDRPVLVYVSGDVDSAANLQDAREIIITQSDMSAKDLEGDSADKKIAAVWEDLGYQSLLQT
jgi:hypothetical protein